MWAVATSRSGPAPAGIGLLTSTSTAGAAGLGCRFHSDVNELALGTVSGDTVAAGTFAAVCCDDFGLVQDSHEPLAAVAWPGPAQPETAIRTAMAVEIPENRMVCTTTPPCVQNPDGPPPRAEPALPLASWTAGPLATDAWILVLLVAVHLRNARGRSGRT